MSGQGRGRRGPMRGAQGHEPASASGAAAFEGVSGAAMPFAGMGMEAQRSLMGFGGGAQAQAPASSGWSLGSLWDSATSAVGSGASWLGEQASGAWEGAKQLGSDAWDAGSSAVSSGIDWAGGVASDAWEGAKGLGSDIYHGLTDWHFEDRQAANLAQGPLPGERDIMSSPDWTQTGDNEAALHQNNQGARERKYINPDGREAVFDGDTGDLITDPAIEGTYNYCVPMPWDQVQGVSDLPEYAWKGAGHLLLDVLPWALGGSVRGDG